MPSASLLHWNNDRKPRLAQIDGQCRRSLAAAAPNPHLIDENLRGYVLALSPLPGLLPRSLHRGQPDSWSPK